MRRNEARIVVLEDQPEEKPMEARPTKVESDIATMQLDIRELRGDMKAANEGIADVRTSVAIVDGKVNSLSVKLDANVQALNGKIDTSVQALHDKIDASVQGLNDKMDTKVQALNDKIDVHVKSLHDKIDANAKSTDTRFDTVDTRFDKVDARFDKVDAKFDEQGKRIDKLCDSVEGLKGRIAAIGIAITLVLGLLAVDRWLSHLAP